MNILIIITLFGLIFLMSFSLCLVLFIFLRRIIINRNQKIFQKKYNLIEMGIFKAISSPDVMASYKIAKKYRFHSKVLIKLLTNYLEFIKGEEKEKLKIIFNHALKEKCIKELDSFWTAKKLKALRLFVLFSEPSDIKMILKFLHDKPILRLTVINALSKIQGSKAASYILQAFAEDPHPNLLSYMHSLYALGNKILDPLKEYLKKPLPPEKLETLIELIGAIPLRPLYPDIAALSNHQHKEIRIKVARALGNMLMPDSIAILKRLASDSSWEVRAQAIKSLGKMNSFEALDIITKGLFSPSWHVRYNAGNALANLGKEGINRLKQVAKQKKDRYAADMASMVLGNIIYSEN